MDTDLDMDTECVISHMECGDLVYEISSHLKILVKSLNFEILSLLAWFRSFNIALINWNSWNICLFKENIDLNNSKYA